MKISTIEANKRKRSFSVNTFDSSYSFPFSKLHPIPDQNNPLDKYWIDEDFGGDAFSYELNDGTTGTIHIDQVLEFNRDPSYMTELLLYKLTVEAKKHIAATQLSNREIIRRLGTSPAHYYRLLDQTNVTKSVNKMFNLLQILGCEIDVVFKDVDKSRKVLVSV